MAEMKYINALQGLLANRRRVNGLVATRERMRQAVDNQTVKLVENTNDLHKAADNQSAAVNERLDRLIEAATNQATDTNKRLDDIVEAITNQSTAANLRLDRLITAVRGGGSGEEAPAGANVAAAQGDGGAEKGGRTKMASSHSASTGSVADDTATIQDIALIERFSHEWQANAYDYQKSLNDLRASARRLLPILSTPKADGSRLKSADMERLRAVEKETACLARQPLFFPEMFHGVSMARDGTFRALEPGEALHLRAAGILDNKDPDALKEVWDRISRNAASPLRAVEIGSAAGRGSTEIAAQYVKRTGGTLYCIDPWGGSWYFTFLANLQIFDIEHTVIPIRSPSVDAAALFDDGSLDAVFVDGSHIYSDVLADIDAYLPKIKNGGIMFGHDLHDLPNRFDRNELLSISNINNGVVNYTNANGDVSRVDVHPGVILAVQDRFGDDVEHIPGSVVWVKQL
jgi:hypothetical protein